MPSTTRRRETNHQMYFGKETSYVYGPWIFLYFWQLAHNLKHDKWGYMEDKQVAFKD
jgi:hypothetical protein